MAEFARALGMSPQALTPYIKKVNPMPAGAILRERLDNLGFRIKQSEIIQGNVERDNGSVRSIPFFELSIVDGKNRLLKRKDYPLYIPKFERSDL